MPLYSDRSDMPAELFDLAAEQDDLIADEAADLIPPPTSPYNAKVLTALSKALAAVGRVMGLDLTPETYKEAEARLAPEVARFLMMMAAAAEDYGQPLPVAMDDIKGDRELTAITAHLMRLAKDKGFSDFLDAPADEEVTDVQIEVSPAGVTVDEEDFDFSSRMRRG